MEYIIPLIAAYLVYIYNYRKVLDLKNKIAELKYEVMNDNDKWIIDKFDKVFREISRLESRLSKLEAKLAIYSGIAVFISTFAAKWVDKLF